MPLIILQSTNILRGLALLLMVLCCGSSRSLAVDPVVSNVQAKQRPGTRLVDITYDLADPDSATLAVYLKVSSDGGKTWQGPVELVTGDVGASIAPSAGKKLTWNAGVEMPNQYGVAFRFKVGADDIKRNRQTCVNEGSFGMSDYGIVTISIFYIDIYEITKEQWFSVRNWAILHGYEFNEGGSFGGNHPIHSVNWYDAVKWCNARSESEGKKPAYYTDSKNLNVYRGSTQLIPFVNWKSGYRLPTEAEWEKAARGGAENKFYSWGTDSITPANANYSIAMKGRTTSVGDYPPNGYGIYDMCGNVWEWCWDEYAPYPIEKVFLNPKGPESISGTTNHKNRVLRGGGWRNNDCKIQIRNNSNPAIGYDYYGFRCVLPENQP